MSAEVADETSAINNTTIPRCVLVFTGRTQKTEKHRGFFALMKRYSCLILTGFKIQGVPKTIKKEIVAKTIIIS